VDLTADAPLFNGVVLPAEDFLTVIAFFSIFLVAAIWFESERARLAWRQTAIILFHAKYQKSLYPHSPLDP
jgi:hypothetical protein